MGVPRGVSVAAGAGGAGWSPVGGDELFDWHAAARTATRRRWRIAEKPFSEKTAAQAACRTGCPARRARGPAVTRPSRATPRASGTDVRRLGSPAAAAFQAAGPKQTNDHRAPYA